MKIKVLNVLTIIEDGGMETLVSRIYQGLLPEKKFEFYVCSLLETQNNYLFEFYKNNCKDVISFNLVNKNLKLRDYFALLISIYKLGWYIRKKKIDVVHSHDFFASVIARLAVLFARFLLFYKPSRNYVTLHNTLNWLSPIHNYANKFFSFFTDKIICVSDSVRQFSTITDKINPSKYIVVYNGIDTQLFRKYDGMNAEVRNELGYLPSDIIIGNISTFSVRKGHIYLLNAFKKLITKYPDVKLLFVGSTREHEQEVASEIFAFINNNNLNNYVKILDTRKDVFKIYNVINYYVMPSIVEGYGLALAEAMASELVCCCSDIPAFSELISDNINGFVFKSKNADSIYSTLEKILSGQTKHLDVGVFARNTIVNKFSYEAMINGYYKLYNIRSY